MDIREKYAIGKLQNNTYRNLQQIAKTLSLPANVKKICLIHLIHAKIFGSKIQVESMIENVNRERQHRRTQHKKKPKQSGWMGLQVDKISSTGGHSNRSPAISATPRRSSLCGPIFVRCSPVLRQSSAMANAPTTRPNATSTITRPTYATASSSGRLKTYPSLKKIPCDRVLRNRRYPAYSNTDFKKPQTYREVLDSNDRAIEFIEKQNILERNNRSLKIVNRSNRSYLNKQTLCKVQTKPPVQRHRPSILSGNGSSPKTLPRKLTYIETCKNRGDVTEGVDKVQNASIEPQYLELSPEVTPAKRQKRVISGIYPLSADQLSTTKVSSQAGKSYEYARGFIGIRNLDGSYSQINTLVKKPPTEAKGKSTITNASTENFALNIQNESNFDFTVQDIISSKIDGTAITSQETRGSSVENYVDASYGNTYPAAQPVMTPTRNTFTNSLTDMSYMDTPMSMTNYRSNEMENLNSLGFCDDCYCHNRIQSEPVITTTITNELPRIHEVFSSFNIVAGLIPAQASTVDCSQCLSYPVYNERHTSNTSMLEMLMNFKRDFLTTQPFSPISTRAVTRCVYSTPAVATAMLYEASTNESVPSPAEDLCVSDDGTTYSPLAGTGAAQNTDQNQSGSTTASLELLASQVGEMESQGTASDMEEALEWISQDGDYMERMGLDIHMQCTLCSWAGPKYNLEHHIRTEHNSRIHMFAAQEWNVTFSLSALRASGLWHSEFIEGTHALYALSASAVQGTFRATLTTLSADTETAQSGTVTVYNAVTGEPQSWSGIVPSYPPTLPHESTVGSELSVQLDTLDVLPRSACEKVVYGQPDFGDIQITVFVKI